MFDTSNTTPLDRPRSSWSVVLVLAALVVGLAVRGVLLVQPPSQGMLWDHHEYVRWGVLMQNEGMLALYDHPPEESLMWNPKVDARGYGRHPDHFNPRTCNYPPLAGYLLYVEMKILHVLDPSLTSNTPAARTVYGLLSVLGDCVVAAGCFALVLSLGGSRLAGAVAFAAVMLLPPFYLDSARWTQTDSWVMAPFVWLLWAMLRQRWLTAGVLWGVALGLKTQGVLFAPVWMFALVLCPWRKRIISGGVVALLVFVTASVPFMLHSGLQWFQESYFNNLVNMYKDTTLKAFNVWYVDLLLCDNLDASVRLLGLEKDVWGKLFLGAGLVGSGVLIYRWRGAYAAAMLAFAAATMLAVVMLPTRVHERYIILPLPFLIAAAALRKRIWIALVPLIVVATVHMLTLDWLGRSRGAGSWPDLLAWQRSQQLERLTDEYEHLRARLPEEDFASLTPPDEYLEQATRVEYAKLRAEVVWQEWSVTVLELASAGGLFVLLLSRPRGVPDRDAVAME